MEHKGETAKQLFTEGYNCAQAVLCAYAEELGLDRTQAERISSSFGGGIGGMREVCGAVSGMCMAAGLKYPYDPNDHQAKKAHYAYIRHLADLFRQETGSIICRELRHLSDPDAHKEPEPRTEAYYKNRPCGELVRLAAEILEQNPKE